ncbi:MAG: hypothetical protein M0D57_04965 [Sphingobacteriales bacterium JAD_PAG50586_3]|nr:MAG: hypothetical protein M0D57_04965 [Sphingobacteriales bacterium JAD_PAG50586_3]
MKTKKLFLSFLIVFVFGAIQAQTTLPNPEFSGRPYYVSGSELKALERADATVDVKVKGMGYGGMETYYTVFGKTSSVRFKKAEMPRLVVKIDGSADPAESIVLARTFELKKDRRRFIKGKSKLGGKSKDISKYDVALDFKKIGDGLYEITITGALEPGEYAFMPILSDNGGANKIKLTCFGVDE